MLFDLLIQLSIQYSNDVARIMMYIQDQTILIVEAVYHLLMLVIDQQLPLG